MHIFSGPISAQNLKSLASAIREIFGGSQNIKVGHVTPARPLLTKFAYFYLGTIALHMGTKFEVSRVSRS